jgi:guanosine-3',5'-bis(diphosphate) 3'-pyrophosphohydrolase
MMGSTDPGVIMKAMKFSAREHRHQRRKDIEQSPYVEHPIRVAELLVNVGGISEPVAVCAALLHDTLEDC